MVKKEVKEWVSRAERDFEEAKFLFDHDRPLKTLLFSSTRLLRNISRDFLSIMGWELEKIHDLVKLVKDAAKFDKSFEKFIPLTEEMADYYIESR